jgi:uncharacterized membrane protein YdbT with pleckstrin-like domain
MVKAGGGNLTGEAGSYPVWEIAFYRPRLFRTHRQQNKDEDKHNEKQEKKQSEKQ